MVSTLVRKYNYSRHHKTKSHKVKPSSACRTNASLEPDGIVRGRHRRVVAVLLGDRSTAAVLQQQKPDWGRVAYSGSLYSSHVGTQENRRLSASGGADKLAVVWYNKI